MIAVLAHKPVNNNARVAGLGQDERKMRNLLQRNALFLRQRMILGGHSLHFIAKYPDHLQIIRIVGKRDDAHIDGTLLYLLQNLVAEIPVNTDLDHRVQLLKPREGLRQNVKARGLVRADVKFAPRRLVELGNGLQRLLLHGQEPLGVASQDLSRRSQLNLFAAAIEKLFTTLLLEQTDLSADCGLSAIELFRRARETAQLRDFQKTGKLVIVHFDYLVLT